MGGERAKQAKDSLILFLKSLSEASLFNIISFGSEFKRMFKQSVPYTDEHFEEAVKSIEGFEADFGGTEILNPLLDIINVEKEMKDFVRHVILLTDGQVSNSDEAIKVIAKMRQGNIATTHIVGIGKGVSFGMIRRGAFKGGGEHLFIMDNKEMKRQIIFLLESITSCEIKNFHVAYPEKVFDAAYPSCPTSSRRAGKAPSSSSSGTHSPQKNSPSRRRKWPTSTRRTRPARRW
jgi:hypothetical protein